MQSSFNDDDAILKQTPPFHFTENWYIAEQSRLKAFKNKMKDYELALRSFHSYNSIPNIEIGEKFYFYDENENLRSIEFPTGCYEISDIESFIQKQMGLDNVVHSDKTFSLKANNNTLKCEIYSNKYKISFKGLKNIGHILGFSEKILLPKQIHYSDLPVQIIKVSTIRFESSITWGAFDGDRPAHTIYEFPIKVDPGYAINETPSNLLYLPVVPQNEITNITVTALDQNGNPVNF
nr:unnamed protein product [Callosobruchus chinensis]